MYYSIISLRSPRIMKKTLLIISALLFLNSATELHQLFRLPMLVQHYRKHQQKDHSLSLISFLKIHYTTDHPVDNDDNDDKQLPFKSDENINHTDNPIVLKKEMPAQPVLFLKRQPARYDAENIPDKNCHSIFHPPRQACISLNV